MYVKFNTMDRDIIEITVKVIFLIGIIWFLVHISNGKNITYKSKGVYEISR